MVVNDVDPDDGSHIFSSAYSQLSLSLVDTVSSRWVGAGIPGGVGGPKEQVQRELQ